MLSGSRRSQEAHRLAQADAEALIRTMSDSVILPSYDLGQRLTQAIGKMDLTATLQEVILVEHFRQPLPLTILDVADWAREFSEFGEPRQLPWLPPIDLKQTQFSIGYSTAQELPRLLLSSITANIQIQLQSDRFAFGWIRTSPVGERASYPGYENLMAGRSSSAQRFNAWCLKRFGVSPGCRLVELTYNNAAPIVVDGRRRRLSEIFRWVQPSRGVNSFQVAWTELMETGRTDGPRVTAIVAVGAAPPVAEALLFNFAGVAPIDIDEGDTKLRAWNALHERIHAIYDAAISREEG